MSVPPTPPEARLTSKEVAKILRMERETVQQYAREGRRAGTRVGRQWLFTSAAVVDFLVAAAK